TLLTAALCPVAPDAGDGPTVRLARGRLGLRLGVEVTQRPGAQFPAAAALQDRATGDVQVTAAVGRHVHINVAGLADQGWCRGLTPSGGTGTGVQNNASSATRGDELLPSK